ncbi:MAG: hypothetical protein Q4A07_13845 [Coriobacteriales bacterium]|nr:hypothetical protein [Coriobacteriales bacterium]
MSATTTKDRQGNWSLSTAGSGMMPQSNGRALLDNKTVAYVDESMRTFDGETTYYLCAVVDRGMDEVAVQRLCSLLPRGAKKLHWRQMGVSLQGDSLKLVGSLAMDVIVVSGRPINPRKQERARRKCLEVLLPLLGSAGVERVVMESRGDALDKRDREMAVSLIRKGWLGDVTLAHMRGGDEPRLWVPDQVLGAQGHVDAKGGAREDWAHEWRRLEKKVERRRIAL